MLDNNGKVKQPLLLEDFPFAEDGLLVWDALVDYFTGYLNLYYSDSGAGGKPKVAQWHILAPCSLLCCMRRYSCKYKVPGCEGFCQDCNLGIGVSQSLAGGGGCGARGLVEGSTGAGAPRQEGGLDRADRHPQPGADPGNHCMDRVGASAPSRRLTPAACVPLHTRCLASVTQ